MYHCSNCETLASIVNGTRLSHGTWILLSEQEESVSKKKKKKRKRDEDETEEVDETPNKKRKSGTFRLICHMVYYVFNY